MQGFLFHEEFLKFDLEKKQINATKTSYIYYKKLLEIKKAYSKNNQIIILVCQLSFVLNLEDPIYPDTRNINGNIKTSKSCELQIDISFNMGYSKEKVNS